MGERGREGGREGEGSKMGDIYKKKKILLLMSSYF